MKIAELTSGVLLGDRFRLKEILGRGSYGDVWLCDVENDDHLPDRVALKIYHHQERATRKLLDEARVSIGFDHERLVRVYGAERIDGLAVMWMDYVAGETLLQRLGDTDEPRVVLLDEILVWMREIAEALAYLHIQDPPIVHGDLKLDNVLIGSDGNLFLTDFGQSRTIEDRFVETQGAGAWPYLAPEILGAHTDSRGRRFVASDIYAFGVMVYRFLTGRFPRATLPEILNQTAFPRPVELNGSVPAELDALVMKCLAKKPENRFQTGAELLAAVDKLREELDGRGMDQPPAHEPAAAVAKPAEELVRMAQELLADGKVEAGLEQLEKTIQRYSTSPGLLLVYAEAAKKAGRFDIARKVYQRAVGWLQASGASDAELRAAREGLSELDVRSKDYEAAVKGFAWLAERWPDNRWYRFRHGVALGLAGKYRRSLQVLMDLYDHEAKPSAVVCAKIGLCYQQLNDIEQAVQYFNEALMLDEYEPTALFHLGRIRAIQGKLGKAEIYLERLSKVEGAESQYRELAHLLGARC